MNKSGLEEIATALLNYNLIYIFPHKNADGDSLGSSSAICRALRNEGKTAFVLLEEPPSKNLSFLIDDISMVATDELLIELSDEKAQFLSLAVDCGDIERLGIRSRFFMEGDTTVCIDHHKTTEPIWDINYIDSKAAATGEIIYSLIKTMGLIIDNEMGEGLFAAITMDTGNFQYSNTSSKTHEIAAELHRIGIDISSVSQKLYERVSLSKIKLESTILSNLEIMCNGRCAFAVLSQKLLRETGAEMDDASNIVSVLRSIDGVELAVFVKEKSDNLCSVSTRSKTYFDVAKLCSRLGGGGHVRAAGATLNMGLDEAVNKMKNLIESSFTEKSMEV